MTALDTERMLAVLYLDSRSGAVMSSLQHDEAATDQALRVVDGVSRLGPVAANASALEKAAAAKFVRAARALPQLRAAVASGAISRAAVISRYSAIVTDGTRVLEQSIQKTDVAQSLVTTALQEVNLYESEQLVREENDIYSGDVLAGRLSAPDQKEFAQLVSLRQYLVADGVPQLDAFSASLYRHYVPTTLTLSLTRLESAIIRSDAGAARPPVPLGLWQATVRTYVSTCRPC
jgi:hypothetical protein